MKIHRTTSDKKPCLSAGPITPEDLLSELDVAARDPMPVTDYEFQNWFQEV